MADMMMMEEEKKEDEGPNGCIVCMGHTWEVIYVSILISDILLAGNLLRHQICSHDNMRGPKLLLVPY